MKAFFRIIDIMVLLLLGCYFVSGWLAKNDRVDYIAHAGGAIDGYVYTNTLEAVENSISHGAKYIELDLRTTSDGYLVATHDWKTFAEQSGIDASPDNPPSYETFVNSKIYGKYTPMTYALIDSVFKANKDLVLVTDKIRDAGVVDQYLHDIRDRVIVECFSRAQFDECRRLGYTPMRSFHNLAPGGVNVGDSFSFRYAYLHFVPTGFAIFVIGRVSKSDADSIHSSDPRVRYVYVDIFE